MINYFSNIRKYAMAFGLTSGILWLVGGILGAYYSGGGFALFLAAAITGGIPILTTFFAARFNIVGSLLLIVEGFSMMLLIYFERHNLIILALLFLSYSLPLILSGITFLRFWYKNKTRI
jgi:hypothetical protein